MGMQAQPSHYRSPKGVCQSVSTRHAGVQSILARVSVTVWLFASSLRARVGGGVWSPGCLTDLPPAVAARRCWVPSTCSMCSDAARLCFFGKHRSMVPARLVVWGTAGLISQARVCPGGSVTGVSQYTGWSQLPFRAKVHPCPLSTPQPDPRPEKRRGYKTPPAWVWVCHVGCWCAERALSTIPSLPLRSGAGPCVLQRYWSLVLCFFCRRRGLKFLPCGAYSNRQPGTGI